MDWVKCVKDQRLAKIWPSVIEAIEISLPYYDRVNQIVSLGLAAKLRRDAAGLLLSKVKDGAVLDLGIGPGNMSLALLEIGSEVKEIVGVDYSTLQLKTAKKQLQEAQFDGIHIVRAIFESLPFKDETFHCAYSGYALRDAVDKASSIQELYRVSHREGRLVIVDMGKPDNLFIRAVMAFYIMLLMPLLAKLVIGQKIHGNPWRKLAATYRALPRNRELLTAVANVFGIDATKLSTRLLGGLVTIYADKIRCERVSVLLS